MLKLSRPQYGLFKYLIFKLYNKKFNKKEQVNKLTTM